jgi:acetyltransferase-like isoleucine patch superfamily enzyme
MTVWERLVRRWRLRRLTRRGPRVLVEGRLWVHGGGRVEVGADTAFCGGGTGIELNSGPGARIAIGAHCRIGEGVSIEARELVQIGDRVRLGAGVKILDNHFHALCGDRHQLPRSEPVIIEDDVIVGAGAIVLPAVQIHSGARIADAAVVTHRVTRGITVAGNPARRVVPS